MSDIKQVFNTIISDLKQYFRSQTGYNDTIISDILTGYNDTIISDIKQNINNSDLEQVVDIIISDGLVTL